MKVLGIIKNIFVGILGIIYFAFVITMTVLVLLFNDYGVTQFEDQTLILIKSDVTPVTDNVYVKGDLVIVKEQKVANLKEGEEVFTYKVDEDTKKVDIEVGVVKTIHVDDNAITFENGDQYGMEFVAGSKVKVYNKVGRYLSIIESQWGFLFTVIVPSFMIFIYELYALIIEIKYGDEKSS